MPSITKRKRDKSAIRTARVAVTEAKYPYLALRKARRATGRDRYVIFYLDANGKRQEGGTGAFDGELELAQVAFAAFKAKTHSPAFGDGKPHQVLISDVLTYYTVRKINSDNAETVIRKDVATNAMKNLGTFFANYSVGDLSPDLARDYIEWRISLGDRRGWHENAKLGVAKARRLQPVTGWNDIRFLNAALYKAWENHKLTHQICLTLPGEAFAKKRERVLSDNEAARLLAAALGWDHRTGKRVRTAVGGHPAINYPLARFIVTGLRSGTRKERCFRIQWVQNFQGGWCDLDKGILHRKAASERVTNKRAPSMAMPGSLWSMARRWRKMSTRFMIEQTNGRPFKDIDAAFKNACVMAGLSIDPADPMKVTPHTLRHTAVTAMLRKGMSCYDVGQMVGMTAQMVENNYAHGSLEDQRAALAQVEQKRLSHTRLTKTRKRG